MQTSDGAGSRPSSEALVHALILVVCVGMVAGAVALSPPGADGVLRSGGHRLPGICMLRATTGLPCPGCGLTRSFVCLVHGDLAAGLAYHRLGPLVLVYVLLQALRHLLWLILPALRARLEARAVWLDRAVVLVGAALLVNWVVTLAML